MGDHWQIVDAIWKQTSLAQQMAQWLIRAYASSFEFFKLGTEPTQYVSGSVPQVQFGENNQQKQELEELF